MVHRLGRDARIVFHHCGHKVRAALASGAHQCPVCCARAVMAAERLPSRTHKAARLRQTPTTRTNRRGHARSGATPDQQHARRAPLLAPPLPPRARPIRVGLPQSPPWGLRGPPRSRPSQVRGRASCRARDAPTRGAGRRPEEPLNRPTSQGWSTSSTSAPFRSPRLSSSSTCPNP